MKDSYIKTPKKIYLRDRAQKLPADATCSLPPRSKADSGEFLDSSLAKEASTWLVGGTLEECPEILNFHNNNCGKLWK